MLHPVRRQGRTDTILLYRFRTPPYVKVGRAAIDEEAMERLERQYPDIDFEWDKILREPPQVLTEQEAARRKDQRDAREARRRRKKPVEMVEVEEAEPDEGTPEIEGLAPQLDGLRLADETDEEDSAGMAGVLTPDEGGKPGDETAGASAAGDAATRRRRRRRRGKRRHGEPGSTPPAGAPPTGSV